MHCSCALSRRLSACHTQLGYCLQIWGLQQSATGEPRYVAALRVLTAIINYHVRTITEPEIVNFYPSVPRCLPEILPRFATSLSESFVRNPGGESQFIIYINENFTPQRGLTWNCGRQDDTGISYLLIEKQAAVNTRLDRFPSVKIKQYEIYRVYHAPCSFALDILLFLLPGDFRPCMFVRTYPAKDTIMTFPLKNTQKCAEV